jgi:hypothetical protein
MATPSLTSALGSGSAAFVTALNTALAALTNPTIQRIDFDVLSLAGLNGREYSALVSYLTGGASLATPFMVLVTEATTLSALATAVAAAIVALGGTPFVVGTQYRRLQDPARASRNPIYVGITIYNTTAGASANWTPQ